MTNKAYQLLLRWISCFPSRMALFNSAPLSLTPQNHWLGSPIARIECALLEQEPAFRSWIVRTSYKGFGLWVLCAVPVELRMLGASKTAKLPDPQHQTYSVLSRAFDCSVQNPITPFPLSWDGWNDGCFPGIVSVESPVHLPMPSLSAQQSNHALPWVGRPPLSPIINHSRPLAEKGQ